VATPPVETTSVGARGEVTRRAAPARPRRRGRAPGEPRNVAWLYVLPGLAFFVLFTFAPLLHAAWLSLYDWDGLTVGKYVGISNYSKAIDDPQVRRAFGHAFELIVFYSFVPLLLGLFLAGMLTRHPLPGFGFFRTVLFMPQTIAGVVIAQAFVWFYADTGPLHALFDKVGLGSLPPTAGWLGDFTWALPSVGVIGTWVTFGLCMVLFVSGVQKISTDLYDAARVDGAGPLREFVAVTIPGLRQEIVVAFVLTTINALRSFDIVYNATNGGPGDQTYVPALLMYQNAFIYNEVGYGCAIAVMLAVLIFVLATVVNVIADRTAS
jgi:raffinose/stachyose/melibiose transport system permease protein